MPDTNDNDIDALLRYLDYLVGGDPQWAHAVRALVAERDALRVEAQNAKTYWRERAERRDAEEKSAADRDLRERLVCAIWPEILRQWREYKDAIDPRGCARWDALEEADKMLAEMREGESDGK